MLDRPENSIARAASTLRKGGMVLVRDASRPARGAIVVASAARTSDDTVNFLASHARGLTAVALLPERAERLGLGLQRSVQVDPLADIGERWLVTVEARAGVSTGISASDRAATIQALANAESRPEDLTTPGHVHPTLADPGGIVVRNGHSEAAIDLMRAAAMEPIATFSQVLGDDGELLIDGVDAFAERHALPVVQIADLRAHRMATESFVRQLSQTVLPTRHGDFLVRAFENRLDSRQHLVLSLGETRSPEPLLVRVHSECLTGDVFHSLRCDCGPQLDEAMRRIAEAGRGIVLYLRQEGRGIGLLDKIRAYALQDEGRDTVEANVELGLPIDGRDYGLAAQILHVLGASRVRLLTNNPEKIQTLAAFGVEIAAREPLLIEPSDDNRAYLQTKKEKLGHLLD